MPSKKTVSNADEPITRKTIPTEFAFNLKQSGSSRQETAKNNTNMNQVDFFTVWNAAVKII
jgi:alpha-D-ribose 1-methylphosphonate 5-triphosphate synthase subunit PhnG